MGIEFVLLQGQNAETTRAVLAEATIQTSVNSALSGLSAAMAAISVLTSSLSTMTIKFDQSQAALIATNTSLAEAKASISMLAQLGVSKGGDATCGTGNASAPVAPSCEPG